MTTTPKPTMVCDDAVTGMSKAAKEYWAKITAFAALKLEFPAVSLQIVAKQVARTDDVRIAMAANVVETRNWGLGNAFSR